MLEPMVKVSKHGDQVTWQFSSVGHATDITLYTSYLIGCKDQNGAMYVTRSKCVVT